MADRDIEEAIKEEEELEEGTVDDLTKETISLDDEDEEYEDPVSKEYKRDMQNWLGFQRREE
tara:strand:- start:2748 stop:2933 length:186 start_codon:yes stop_codon:yes gene_type:complete